MNSDFVRRLMLIIFGLTISADTNFGATFGTFTGGDPGEGLDLTGKFVFAVNIGPNTTSPGVAGDAAFTADNAPGVTVVAGEMLADWHDPEYGSSQGDNVIESVMRSIRWSSATSRINPSVHITLNGLKRGGRYKLQMLFSESCCVRAFDIIIEGKEELKDFSPGKVQGKINNRAIGVAVTHEFVAGDSILEIVLDGTRAPSPDYPDHNPIISGLTLELLADPPTDLKPETLIADSVADFSDTQGNKGWFYGYYDATADTDKAYDFKSDFKRFRNFGPVPDFGNRDAWYHTVGVGGFYSALWSRGGCPNSASTFGGDVRRLREEHWVVRRWESSVFGKVTINVSLAKENTESAPPFDGIQGRVLIDGVVVFEKTLAPNDAVGTSIAIEAYVNEGSFIDFLIHPNVTVHGDWTTFTSRITHSDSEKTPFSISNNAIEILFPTETGKMYNPQFSTDLKNWDSISATAISGSGEDVNLLFSTRNRPYVFYRLLEQ